MIKETFFNYIDQIVRTETSLNYSWNDSKNKIKFYKANENGFDVVVETDGEEINIETDIGYHTHFDGFENIENVLVDVMGLVRDLLSEKMRIIELTSNNSPYLWKLQIMKENEWVTYNSMGFFIWNYFGKKNKNIFQNNILPIRE